MTVAVGVCVGDQDRYDSIAAPTLAGRTVILESDPQSIAAAYNRVLGRALSIPDLKGLVLIHEDVALLDGDLDRKLADLFADGTVAIVGVVGARPVASITWWGYRAFGRAQEATRVIDHGGGTHDVDAVDGLLLALSPWAVRNLRFDEACEGWHGYDADICFQARHRNRRVLVTDLDVVHHTRRKMSGTRAHQRADRWFRKKWAPPGRRARAVWQARYAIARVRLAMRRRRARLAAALERHRRGPVARP